MAREHKRRDRGVTHRPNARERLESAMRTARRWLGLVRPVPEKLWSADARSYLRRPGCPVCHAILEWFPRHLFWFFEEQYHHPSTVSDMQDSLGFCRTHARKFLEISPPYRIGYLHLLMFQGTLGRLRRVQRSARAALRAREIRGGPRVEVKIPTEGLDRRDACLICRQEWETVRLTSHLLIYALRDPEILADIESFGKFCTPHFRWAAEVSPGHLLRLLIPIQAKGLLGVDRAHALLPHEPSSGVEAAQPLRSTCAALAKAVGADVNDQRHRAQAGIPPALQPGQPPSDPVPSPDRMRALLAEPRCPICTLTQEALTLYLAWYKAGLAQWLASSHRRGEGFGRLCRDHTWSLARDAEPALLLDLGLAFVEDDRASLEQAEAILTAPHPLPPWRAGVRIGRWPRETRAWVGKMYRREERRLAGAKWVICETPECPACAHARTMTRRSLALLFAVLQDAEARSRYRGAWGLCMQHFSDGLSLPMAPEILEAVVDVQIARLATLEWELEEYFRKASWDVRYEPKGPEQTAWARAIERFSGTGLRAPTVPGRQCGSPPR